MERHGGGANLNPIFVLPKFLLSSWRQLPFASVFKRWQYVNGWRITKRHDVGHQLPDLGLCQQALPRRHGIAAALATIGNDVKQHVGLQFRSISQGRAPFRGALRPVTVAGAEAGEYLVACLDVLYVTEVDSPCLLA